MALAVITCGFGSIILLLIISKNAYLKQYKRILTIKKIREFLFFKTNYFDNQNIFEDKNESVKKKATKEPNLKKQAAVLNHDIKINEAVISKPEESPGCEEMRIKACVPKTFIRDEKTTQHFARKEKTKIQKA